MRQFFGSPHLLAILGLVALWAGCAQGQALNDSAEVAAPKVEHVRPTERLTSQTLPHFLEAVRTGYDLPAMGVGIVFQGKVSIFTTGVRKLGDPTPVTNDDCWALGSCTKSMTAILMATFVESGQLKWDSTLAEMLPDLADVMLPAYRQVTLRQLLSHRAGFPKATVPLGDSWAKWITKTEPVTQQRTEYMKWFLSREPVYVPGTKVLYSNVGYVAAGAIAERLTGKSWEELIRERVFELLGMNSVTFGTQNTAKPLEPWPHFWQDGQTWVASPDPNATGHSREHPSMEFPMVSGPYGTVRCSLQDWGKYAQFWMDGINGQNSIISAASFKFLATAPDEMLAEGITTQRGYACGWYVYDCPWSKGKILSHGGTNSKNNSVIWLAPTENFAVMVVANRDEAESALDDVAAPLVNELFRRSQ